MGTLMMIVAMFGRQRATKAATTRITIITTIKITTTTTRIIIITIITREAQIARTGTTRTTKIRIIRTRSNLQRMRLMVGHRLQTEIMTVMVSTMIGLQRRTTKEATTRIITITTTIKTASAA